MTDTAVILALSNIGTASALIIAFGGWTMLRDEQRKAERDEAKADRQAAEAARDEFNHTRERSFADYFADRQFAAQPEQQHAAVDTPAAAALSDLSHADEQTIADEADAPAEDDDHAGWWRMLAALVWDLADLVHEHTPAGWCRVWFGPGDEAPTGEGIRAVLVASGYELEDEGYSQPNGETVAEAEATEVAAIIDAHRRKTLYLPTGAHPMVTLTGAEVGRHRKDEVAA